jgi:hypothetical protein
MGGIHEKRAAPGKQENEKHRRAGPQPKQGNTQTGVGAQRETEAVKKCVSIRHTFFLLFAEWMLFIKT